MKNYHRIILNKSSAERGNIVGVSSMKGHTILFKPSKLKSLLCTSTDNQKWIFSTKRQHSVKTESRLWFLFPVKKCRCSHNPSSLLIF